MLGGFCVSVLFAGCGVESTTSSAATPPLKLETPTVVEASCGQCQLAMEEKKGCDLAIRHEGNAYFVDGFKMTDLEKDSHAAGGLCVTVRKAKVTGETVNGRFVAKTFELVPAEA